jgi:DNA invertase Pin-like site-specific DNA recombinase
MEQYIGYVRTSTGKQILGLEEQKSRLKQFAQQEEIAIVKIFVEQESGKNNERKELNAAIDICLKYGYTLLFTKLDRLTREVDFLFTLRNKGVKLRCIELPELNTLTLGIFGSVAQWERELISSRTKRGLDELRKKGIKLGTPRNLTSEARRKGTRTILTNKLNNDKWRMAKMFIENYRMKHNHINLTEIAKLLNEEGFKTRNGSFFSPTTVKRLLSF